MVFIKKLTCLILAMSAKVRLSVHSEHTYLKAFAFIDAPRALNYSFTVLYFERILSTFQNLIIILAFSTAIMLQNFYI